MTAVVDEASVSTIDLVTQIRRELQCLAYQWTKPADFFEKREDLVDRLMIVERRMRGERVRVEPSTVYRQPRAAVAVCEGRREPRTIFVRRL